MNLPCKSHNWPMVGVFDDIYAIWDSHPMGHFTASSLLEPSIFCRPYRSILDILTKMCPGIPLLKYPARSIAFLLFPAQCNSNRTNIVDRIEEDADPPWKKWCKVPDVVIGDLSEVCLFLLVERFQVHLRPQVRIEIVGHLLEDVRKLCWDLDIRQVLGWVIFSDASANKNLQFGALLPFAVR
ncbi:hypothetical protein PsorP6_000758 [Peronosclerospora sorghi]|uniref:Uncharacterized protein n=1 Tax=Peronosclerospora sorghi TaxID=230839 RepID=A0ACC0WSI2_9STRA|nr:hypothetical protein PsorP6_000758 [Peronosclerospora sorghi]